MAAQSEGKHGTQRNALHAKRKRRLPTGMNMMAPMCRGNIPNPQGANHNGLSQKRQRANTKLDVHDRHIKDSSGPLVQGMLKPWMWVTTFSYLGLTGLWATKTAAELRPIHFRPWLYVFWM